jgi:hypothetical protein
MFVILLWLPGSKKGRAYDDKKKKVKKKGERVGR